MMIIKKLSNKDMLYLGKPKKLKNNKKMVNKRYNKNHQNPHLKVIVMILIVIRHKMMTKRKRKIKIRAEAETRTEVERIKIKIVIVKITSTIK